MYAARASCVMKILKCIQKVLKSDFRKKTIAIIDMFNHSSSYHRGESFMSYLSCSVSFDLNICVKIRTPLEKTCRANDLDDLFADLFH